MPPDVAPEPICHVHAVREEISPIVEAAHTYGIEDGARFGI